MPNVITAFGLACGLFVIFKVNMIEVKSHFDIMLNATFLLLLAALADFIDGAVARVFRAESEFGFMFDSLADAVSFGVAPAVLMLKSMTLYQGSWIAFMCATAAMIYSLCGILRLVRFNVKSAEARGNLIEISAKKKHFTGLPIPAAAAATVSINLLFLSPFFNHFFSISLLARAITMSLVMAVIGYLMVSRWKFFSLKGLNIRVASFPVIVGTVIIAICFFYGVLYYFPIVLVLLTWSYVVFSMILNILRKIMGKKAKGLKDFDTEKDEESLFR